jgi:hypothetical protein
MFRNIIPRSVAQSKYRTLDIIFNEINLDYDGVIEN